MLTAQQQLTMQSKPLDGAMMPSQAWTISSSVTLGAKLGEITATSRWLPPALSPLVSVECSTVSPLSPSLLESQYLPLKTYLNP